MRLYLDDDTCDAVLVQLLRKAGHDVQIPADASMTGKKDFVHLRHAIREKRVCLTQNYDDFQGLHDLVLEAHGSHPGVLVIRKDNDRRRDLKPAGIVRALSKMAAAGFVVANQYVTLNHWR